MTFCVNCHHFNHNHNPRPKVKNPDDHFKLSKLLSMVTANCHDLNKSPGFEVVYSKWEHIQDTLDKKLTLLESLYIREVCSHLWSLQVQTEISTTRGPIEWSKRCTNSTFLWNTLQLLLGFTSIHFWDDICRI